MRVYKRCAVGSGLYAVAIAVAVVLASACSGDGGTGAEVSPAPNVPLIKELPPVPKGSRIDAEARQSIKLRVDDGYNAGIVAGLVDPSGREFFSYGATSFADGVTPDENTVFEIGSVTKVFTTLLLADMVLNGEVLLEDPVNLYLPGDLAAPESVQSMALVHLATHTSGLPRLPDNLPYTDPENPYSDYTLDRMYDFIAGYTPRDRAGRSVRVFQLRHGAAWPTPGESNGHPLRGVGGTANHRSSSHGRYQHTTDALDAIAARRRPQRRCPNAGLGPGSVDPCGRAAIDCPRHAHLRGR